MAIIYTRQADAVDMGGIAVEQSWIATDDLTGVSIQKSYPLPTTQAAIEADLAALFPANPTVSQEKLETLKVMKDGAGYKIVDNNGKVIFLLARDALGNASVEVVDGDGNRRRVLTPQAGSVKLDNTATIADITFPTAFDEHPIVNITPSKPLPNYDLNVTKTGFTIDLASAPGSTIAWEAKSRKK